MILDVVFIGCLIAFMFAPRDGHRRSPDDGVADPDALD